MSRYDFNAQRLFVEADLVDGGTVACTPAQTNYLRNVLRLEVGDSILVFNGRHGEWRAELTEAGRRGTALAVRIRTRPQEGGPDIDYLFAPLKRARLDYMVEKATEMGAARLRPVLTRRTVAASLGAALAYFTFQVLAQAIWGPALPPVPVAGPRTGKLSAAGEDRRCRPARRPRGSRT